MAPASARSKGEGGKAGAGRAGEGRGKGKGQQAQRAQVWEGPVRTARQLATLLWREVVVMMRNPADVAGEALPASAQLPHYCMSDLRALKILQMVSVRQEVQEGYTPL